MSLPTGPVALDNTYGSLLVGTCFGLVLYGLSLHQLFRYARLFPSDVLSIRLLVTGVMGLETFHAVLTMHLCYHYLVTNYLQPQILLQAIWSLQLIPGLTAFTACVSKIFLARRVFLTGTLARWAVGVVAVLLTAELGLAIVLTYKGFVLANLLSYAHSVVGILIACIATATAADFLLAGTLIVTLQSQKYNYWRGYSWVDIFSTYLVKSGLLTGICNLLALILALVRQESFIYAAVNIITTRLYANTLLAVLNSRKLMASGRLEVFADADTGIDFNAIARATRVAQAERWNAPTGSSLPQR
ncbi:hypothetical protein C8Q79DRAFT_656088 [Trametes meyenii]|nr:hypothetical protein C8Q79DRAFT_656088 [Trametes meyenii]